MIGSGKSTDDNDFTVVYHKIGHFNIMHKLILETDYIIGKP